MSWTEERIELLKKLWADGVSAGDIAERLGKGVTRNAVIGKAHRLGLVHGGRVRKARTGDMASARAPKKRDPAEGISIKKRVANPLGWRAKRVKPKVKPKSKPMSVRKQRPAKPIGLLDLISSTMCRWPVNDPPKGGRYLFCGAGTFDSTPYCEYHARIAYAGTRPRHPEDLAPAPVRRAA